MGRQLRVQAGFEPLKSRLGIVNHPVLYFYVLWLGLGYSCKVTHSPRCLTPPLDTRRIPTLSSRLEKNAGNMGKLVPAFREPISGIFHFVTLVRGKIVPDQCQHTELPLQYKSHSFDSIFSISSSYSQYHIA